MTDLTEIIAFWEAILLTHRWTMAVSFQTLVEQTIKALDELKALKEN